MRECLKNSFICSNSLIFFFNVGIIKIVFLRWCFTELGISDLILKKTLKSVLLITLDPKIYKKNKIISKKKF